MGGRRVNLSGRIRHVNLVAATAAVVGSVACGFGRPAWWGVPTLALVVAISEIAVVHLSFGRQRVTFSLTEGAIAAAFVSAAGAWTVPAVTAGVLAAQAVRRQPRIKVAFNVAQFAACTALGALTSTSLGGGIRGAIAGMSVFWLFNNLLVASAVSITSRQRFASLLWASAPLGAVHSAGTSSIGLLAAWLTLHEPLGLLGLVVPLLLLWLSYDEQTARAAEARLFAELARLQERASERSIDVSAQVVLTAAARLFGGADVEMVLLGAEGPVTYCGDEHGVHRSRGDSEALDQPWVLRALGSSSVRVGTEKGRSFCSATLGPAHAPLAVLVARRPVGAAAFGRREVMLAEVLVQQAESWLSVAELTQSRDRALAHAEAAQDAARALGDIGAHTAPALGVLRESAVRLARLAAQPGGPNPVGDIVEELHAVERAVASLLGAIALAAEPELHGIDADGSGLVGADGRAAEDDWTTTGVLAGADLSS